MRAERFDVDVGDRRERFEAGVASLPPEDDIVLPTHAELQEDEREWRAMKPRPVRPATNERYPERRGT